MGVNETLARWGRGECALCGESFGQWGNNPDPLGDIEQRVCDACNNSFVLPARMYMFTSAQVRALRSIIEHRAPVR